MENVDFSCKFVSRFFKVLSFNAYKMKNLRLVKEKEYFAKMF